MFYKNMSKLESPFIRNDVYNVIDEVRSGYEWVFTDSDVMCVEKLDGTNLSIGLEEGKLVRLMNRENVIPISILDSNMYLDGIRTTYNKGRLPSENIQHFGELMGPKIQGNFLNLDRNEWFPFEYLQQKYAYISFHRYEKTFNNLSSWFKNDIFSLVYIHLHAGEKVRPEGVVFTHPDGRMAKLRLDMFDWYKGPKHKQRIKNEKV